MKTKTIALVSIIFCIILVFAVYVRRERPWQQKIIFTNKSKYHIDLVEIDFSDQKLTLTNIHPESTIREDITAVTDSSFNVKVNFSDDLSIEEKNLGYITNWDGSNHKFIITKEKKLIVE